MGYDTLHDAASNGDIESHASLILLLLLLLLLVVVVVLVVQYFMVNIRINLI